MICDKCKNEISSAANFCPSCGAKVEPSQSSAAPGSTGGTAPAGPEVKQANVEKATPSQALSAAPSKSSKGPLIVVLVALLVLVGAGGYFLYNAFMVKSPTKLGEQINNELKAKGLNLYCEVDKNWTATLKGSVKSPADKEAAMGVVKAHKEVKDVKDELQSMTSPSDLKLAVDNALLGAGYVDVLADVDENLVATLKGTVSTENEKTGAVNVAKAVDKVKDVKDNIQIQAEPPAETVPQPSLPEEKPKETKHTARDAGRRHPTESASLNPFELEVKINRALQKAGLRRVRARVGERFGVFLNGRVDSEGDKARAIEIASSFDGVRRVRDKMRVDAY
jgi:osmotically-inducible protein OsmY